MSEYRITTGVKFVAVEPLEEDGSVLITLGNTKDDDGEFMVSIALSGREIGQLVSSLHAALEEAYKHQSLQAGVPMGVGAALGQCVPDRARHIG